MLFCNNPSFIRVIGNFHESFPYFNGPQNIRFSVEISFLFDSKITFLPKKKCLPIGLIEILSELVQPCGYCD